MCREAGNDSCEVTAVEVAMQTVRHRCMRLPYQGFYKAIPLAVIAQLMEYGILNVAFWPFCLLIVP